MQTKSNREDNIGGGRRRVGLTLDIRIAVGGFLPRSPDHSTDRQYDESNQRQQRYRDDGKNGPNHTQTKRGSHVGRSCGGNHERAATKNNAGTGSIHWVMS